MPNDRKITVYTNYATPIAFHAVRAEVNDGHLFIIAAEDAGASGIVAAFSPGTWLSMANVQRK